MKPCWEDQQWCLTCGTRVYVLGHEERCRCMDLKRIEELKTQRRILRNESDAYLSLLEMEEEE